MNIILIEDDEIVREAIGFLLTQDGHSVMNSVNTQEALLHTNKKAIDMVLCDISIAMREADTYAKMWDAFNAVEVPVIIISIEGDETKSHFVSPPDIDKLLQELNAREKLKESGNRADRSIELSEVSAAIFHEEIFD
jgi:DNA-binding NarL/FixJ family response regulator